MNLQDIKFPLRLCVELMYYSTWLNDKTKDITPTELYEKLSLFFTEEQIEESRKILCGDTECD